MFRSRRAVSYDCQATCARSCDLDEPGAQVEIEKPRMDAFELRGVLPIAANQQWFWTRTLAEDGT